MDVTLDEKKQQKLEDILKQLASSLELLCEESKRETIYKELEDIYYCEDGDREFRHFYSGIFSLLQQIEFDDEQQYSIDVLSENLNEIRKDYLPMNHDQNGNVIDISEKINKLYDHVNLDIERLNYFAQLEWKLKNGEELSKLKTDINEISYSVKSASEKQENLSKKFERQQREYVAILSIFAAVVLAFTGGIAFSTSVLQNISDVSIYRIVIISLIIGAVLVNILYSLFYFLYKLIYNKAVEKTFIVIVANLFFIISIIVVMFAWYFGIVENRNIKINGDSYLRYTEMTTE